MRRRFLLVTSGLIAGVVPLPAVAASAARSCGQTDVPTAVKLVPIDDRFVAERVRAPAMAQNITFPGVADSEGHHRILAAQPMYSSILLDDGSALAFVRNIAGDGAIIGAQIYPSAKCLTSAWGQQNSPETTTEITAGDLGSSRVSFRLEHLGAAARVSRVVRTTKDSGKVIETAEPLIVTKRPVDAIGVYPPPIHGGARILMFVTQERNGSWSVSWYSVR